LKGGSEGRFWECVPGLVVKDAAGQ